MCDILSERTRHKTSSQINVVTGQEEKSTRVFRGDQMVPESKLHSENRREESMMSCRQSQVQVGLFQMWNVTCVLRSKTGSNLFTKKPNILTTASCTFREKYKLP